MKHYLFLPAIAFHVTVFLFSFIATAADNIGIGANLSRVHVADSIDAIRHTLKKNDIKMKDVWFIIDFDETAFKTVGKYPHVANSYEFELMLNKERKRSYSAMNKLVQQELKYKPTKFEFSFLFNERYEPLEGNDTKKFFEDLNKEGAAITLCSGNVATADRLSAVADLSKNFQKNKYRIIYHHRYGNKFGLVENLDTWSDIDEKYRKFIQKKKWIFFIDNNNLEEEPSSVSSFMARAEEVKETVLGKRRVVGIHYTRFNSLHTYDALKAEYVKVAGFEKTRKTTQKIEYVGGK